jgi:hypothetical protein
MKQGKKLIGELHDKCNKIILDAILQEASRDGFKISLSFPNKSKWLKAKVPIWFGTGGLMGRYFLCLFFVCLFFVNSDFLSLLFPTYISYRRISAKEFQVKFNIAEELAAKMMLPGAHSAGDSADGEDLPQWVSIFQRYWEYKKSHPSKTALEEQKREVGRTMQRTILGPIHSLGEITNEVVNETSSAKSKHKTSKSLIVEGGKR